MKDASIYVRFIYEEGDEHWDDTYGPFSKEAAITEANNMKKEFDYAISQGCAEVGFMVNGEYLWNLK